MKLHACRHCGSRLRTYTELQEHLKTHPNVCVTCYRVFSNRSILLAHTCKVGEYLCEICHRSYSTQTKLARHKRETSCRHSLPPEAKRQKPMPPTEDLGKRHHHHLSTNTVPNFKTLLYKTGVVSEHTRVTDQSSHDTTSD